MSWYQEELANRVAEWMTTHGVDEANKGRLAAHALLFFLDRYGYAVVAYDTVHDLDGGD